MKISDKRKEALYDAICDPILKVRIGLEKELHETQERSKENIDFAMYKATQEIWKKVIKILEIGE